jgi:hypothetical protein
MAIEQALRGNERTRDDVAERLAIAAKLGVRGVVAS